MRHEKRSTRRAIPALEPLDSRVVPSTGSVGPMSTIGIHAVPPTSGSNFIQNGNNYGTFGPGGIGILRGHFHHHHAAKPTHHVMPTTAASLVGVNLNVQPPGADPPPAPGSNFIQNGNNYGTFGPGGTGILR
jgi:hypothetical protein